MTPHRIALKLYFSGAVRVDAPAFVPTFHRWIRQRSVEGMLIDVADYKHVHHGPATVLIAHEMDYVIDLSEGRPGLTYVRKRAATADDLAGDLRDGLSKLLVAAEALAADPSPHGPVSFRTDEVRVQVIDRLRYPHDAAHVERVRAAIAELADVFGGELSISDDAGDKRGPISLRLGASATEPSVLLERLNATVRA